MRGAGVLLLKGIKRAKQRSRTPESVNVSVWGDVTLVAGAGSSSHVKTSVRYGGNSPLLFWRILIHSNCDGVSSHTTLPRLLWCRGFRFNSFFERRGSSEGAALLQTFLWAHKGRLNPSLFCSDPHHLTVYWHCCKGLKHIHTHTRTCTHTAVFVGSWMVRPAACHCRAERPGALCPCMFVCVGERDWADLVCVSESVWFLILHRRHRQQSPNSHEDWSLFNNAVYSFNKAAAHKMADSQWVFRHIRDVWLHRGINTNHVAVILMVTNIKCVLAFDCQAGSQRAVGRKSSCVLAYHCHHEVHGPRVSRNEALESAGFVLLRLPWKHATAKKARAKSTHTLNFHIIHTQRSVAKSQPPSKKSPPECERVATAARAKWQGGGTEWRHGHVIYVTLMRGDR